MEMENNMILPCIRLWQLDIMPYIEESDLDEIDTLKEDFDCLYGADEFYYEVEIPEEIYAN
jgi:hypothetical protein